MAEIINEQNFESQVIEASKLKPVLVDFFATWCGPCKMQGPIIDELAQQMGDKAIIVKANIEEVQSIADKYEVMSVPTMLLFKDGKVEETAVGLHTKDALTSLIENYL